MSLELERTWSILTKILIKRKLKLLLLEAFSFSLKYLGGTIGSLKNKDLRFLHVEGVDTIRLYIVFIQRTDDSIEDGRVLKE